MPSDLPPFLHTASRPSQSRKIDKAPKTRAERAPIKVPENVRSVKAMQTSLAARTVPAPASIAELARALKHDVDLIYEWTYSNVDFFPRYISQRGDLGTMIDQVGCSFEQASLMVALLRESGYTANFVSGSIRLEKADIEQWLATEDSPGIYGTADILSMSGIPFDAVYDEFDELLYVDLSHVWVQVEIDDVDYVFDPSYKVYNYTSGIDLSTAISYNQTTLIDDAEDGATITGGTVQNINGDNIRDHFRQYGTDLLDWIRTNNFAASMAEIIGGRTIQQLSSTPVRNIELPYQTPETAPEIWTDIPNEDRQTYTVTLRDEDPYPVLFTETFFTDEIYGKRLTISFNGSDEAELRLDGMLIATSATAVTPNVRIPAEFACGLGWVQAITTGQVNVLSLSFGAVSQNMVDYHRQILQQNIAGGGSSTDESVMGESLEVLWFMHCAQRTLYDEICNQLGKCLISYYVNAGVVLYSGSGPMFDLAGILLEGSSRVGDSDLASRARYASFYLLNGLEAGIMQQNYPVKGINTQQLLNQANEDGQVTYQANILNWAGSGGVREQLTNWDNAMDALNFQVLLQENWIAIHEDGQTTVEDFVGGGWYAGYPGVAPGGLISGGLLGGGTGAPVNPTTTTSKAAKAPPRYSTSPGQPGAAPNSKDPVSLYSGAFLYDRNDMTLGSSQFPYSLNFSRSYSSANKFNDSPLGFGWTHNLDTKVAVSSNGMRSAGELSPKEAAAAIAHAYAMIQLYPDITDSPLTKLMIAAISTLWLMGEWTNNQVTVIDGGNTKAFLKLVDGSYNPPPGYADVLIQNVDDSFTVTSPQQHEWNFNLDGTIDTFVDPAGVTVSYTYNLDGLVETVSNGLDRTLTLGYDAGRLQSVSDGNARENSFAFDVDGNLVEYTDAEGRSITYEYESQGLLTKIFLPENPSTAFVTNGYDSLGRVMTQSGSNTGITSFFLAGYRSEEVDPLGNRHIMYYNELGSLLRDIDALGNETTFERDGLNRLILQTLPEGNSTETAYDENNNVLSITQIAKPGSGLSNIVNSFTYETTWNKVESFEDGEGNITSYEYDPTQGTLLKIIRPEIDSQIPEVNFTYNARGQVETRTDETGIVDKFVYDGTNEELLTSTHDFGVGQLNLETAFDYNDWGDVTSITDPRGNTTTFEFDKERRMTLKTECTPFEFESTWVYDDNGQKTSFSRETGEIDPALQTWQWLYFANGMTRTITDPAGNETNFEYDTVGRLSKRIDAENRIWVYQYDAVGRILFVIDPMGKISEARTYTNNGFLETITDARSNVTSYEYDGFDRLKKRIYPDDTFEGYTYNANNQVLTLTTRAGDVITNTYDVLTRLETRDPASLPLQTMTYDLAGRLEKLNTPSSADPTSGDYEWFYDTAGRLLTQKMPDAREVTYELDENGNKTKLIWPDSYYAEYFYDELNRLTDIKLNGSGTAAVHFDYDDLSRRTLITYENGCTCSYAWEINDDLTDLEHTFDSSSVAWQFAYNKVHQVTSKNVDNVDYAWPSPTAFSKTKYGAANNLNQYPSVAGVAQDYDDNGNLTSGVLTATFDVLNRMTQATLGGTTVDFVYDPNNRQAQKSVSSVDTGFLYDGVQLIAEYDGSTLEKRYIPGILPDEVLIKIESSTKTYFHKDRLGSVVAVTDASGDVLNIFKYGPFGETPSLTGTPFGYTGQRYDAEIQSYYYKARYYSPGIGRFVSPDPIRFDAGDLNLYAYVGNDAVNVIDPSGLAGRMSNTGTSQGLTLKGGVDYWEYEPQPLPPINLGPSQEELMQRMLAERAQANAYQAYAAWYSSIGTDEDMKPRPPASQYDPNRGWKLGPIGRWLAQPVTEERYLFNIKIGIAIGAGVRTAATTTRFAEVASKVESPQSIFKQVGFEVFGQILERIYDPEE